MGDKISDKHASDYWIGPYGVRVPSDINFVVASDEYNRHRWTKSDHCTPNYNPMVFITTKKEGLEIVFLAVYFKLI